MGAESLGGLAADSENRSACERMMTRQLMLRACLLKGGGDCRVTITMRGISPAAVAFPVKIRTCCSSSVIRLCASSATAVAAA